MPSTCSGPNNEMATTEVSERRRYLVNGPDTRLIPTCQPVRNHALPQSADGHHRPPDSCKEQTMTTRRPGAALALCVAATVACTGPLVTPAAAAEQDAPYPSTVQDAYVRSLIYWHLHPDW